MCICVFAQNYVSWYLFKQCLDWFGFEALRWWINTLPGNRFPPGGFAPRHSNRASSIQFARVLWMCPEGYSQPELAELPRRPSSRSGDLKARTPRGLGGPQISDLNYRSSPVSGRLPFMNSCFLGGCWQNLNQLKSYYQPQGLWERMIGQTGVILVKLSSSLWLPMTDDMSFGNQRASPRLVSVLRSWT